MYFSFSALLSVLRQVKSLRSATWSVQSVPETQGSLTYSVRLLDGTEKRPTEKQAHLRAEAWRPYRGIAAMVLWRFHSALRRGDVLMD